jgi:HK97 gp10 family phage protein
MAADQFTFEIKGLDALQSKLESLPKKMANKVLRGALGRAAMRVLEAVVDMAPRASGFMAEHFNIKVSIKSADIAGAAYIGPDGKMDYPNRGGGYKTRFKTGKDDVGRIPVATVVRFNEFGTEKEPANPFMSRAWESTKDEALSILVDGINEGLAEAEKS